MKAIALIPGSTNLTLTDRPEPTLRSQGDVKLRVLQVGICGTDREEAAGGRADPPQGANELIIGHEMLGRVVEVGSAVTGARIGDLGLFSVRRSCGRCPACAFGRNDICFTGDYTERGIKGADGYDAEYVVDEIDHFVRLPADAEAFGVLTEPMSVVAKGISQAERLSAARIPAEVLGEGLGGRSILVAGLGAVGLLAVLALGVRGADIHALDLFDPDNPRAEIVARAGGVYIDGRDASTGDKHSEHFDFIFEAAGVAHLEFDLLQSLAPNGVYVALGIPAGDRLQDLDGAAIFRNLVLKNQTLAGSVNAGIGHFRTAVADLSAANRRWPGIMEELITSRRPYSAFEAALRSHAPDEIKSVLEWGKG